MRVSNWHKIEKYIDNLFNLYNNIDDILRKIFYDSDTKTQIILKQTCKKFNEFPIMCIDRVSGEKMTDKTLTYYLLLRELNINMNRQITDKGLKHLYL